MPNRRPVETVCLYAYKIYKDARAVGKYEIFPLTRYEHI
jgi:hypothetical protein